MQIKLSTLLLTSSFLAVVSNIVSTCPTPNSSHPLSLCAYCSDERAGVRWVADKSDYMFSDLHLFFNCTSKDGNFTIHNYQTNGNYPCFGYFDGSVATLRESGRVHIIHDVLPPETECVFRGYKNLFGRRGQPYFEAVASCSVKDRSECGADLEACRLPANCSESDANHNKCLCQCTEGYGPDTRDFGAVCNDVNECSEEPDSCSAINGSTCVNTEGSFSCVCENGTMEVLDGHNTSCSLISGSNISVTSQPTFLISTSSVHPDSSLTDSLVSSPTLHTSLPTLISQSTAVPTALLPDVTVFIQNESIPLTLTLGVLFSIVFVVTGVTFAAILIGVPLRTRKQQRRPQLPFITDEFDPDFYPSIKIEENHEFKMSTHSILHSLEQEIHIEHLLIDKPISNKEEKILLDHYNIIGHSSERDDSSSSSTSSNLSISDEDEDEVINCSKEPSIAIPLHDACATASIQPVENRTQPIHLDTSTSKQEYQSAGNGYVMTDPDNFTIPSVDCSTLSTHAPATISDQQCEETLKQDPSDTLCIGVKMASDSNHPGYLTLPDLSQDTSDILLPTEEVSLCENFLELTRASQDSDVAGPSVYFDFPNIQPTVS